MIHTRDKKQETCQENVTKVDEQSKICLLGLVSMQYYFAHMLLFEVGSAGLSSVFAQSIPSRLSLGLFWGGLPLKFHAEISLPISDDFPEEKAQWLRPAALRPHAIHHGPPPFGAVTCLRLEVVRASATTAALRPVVLERKRAPGEAHVLTPESRKRSTPFRQGA